MTSFFAETTSKILVLASDGKVFTLDASKLPGGRGQGEPIRLMADIDESASIVAVWAYTAGMKRLIASSDGNGFVVGDDELLSSTRKGRAVLNVDRAGDGCVDRFRRRGTMSRSWGRTASFWCFRSPSSTKWRAARARGFSGTRTAAFPTPRSSARRRALLARLGRAHLHSRQARAQRLDRQPRRGRAPPAERLSEEQ